MSLLFLPIASVLVNVTVDDQFGDPTTGLVPDYFPNNETWHIGSPNEQCPACRIQPSTLDLNQIHDQTWHDGTSYPPDTFPTITVHFTGSAVYVFNILPNALPNQTDTYAHISFSIDGEDPATFVHTSDRSPTILYNHLVYYNAELPHGPHTLVMAAAGSTSSLILFDYLLYTTYSNDTTSTTTLNNVPQSPPFSSTTSRSAPVSTLHGSSQSPSSNAPIRGAIIGAVVGAIVALLLGVAIGAFLLRRKRARSNLPAGTQREDGKRRRSLTSGTEVIHGGSGAYMPVSATPAFPPESLDGAPTGANQPCLASDVSRVRPDTRPPLPTADIGSSSTALWAGHRMKCIRRPAAEVQVQHTGSASSPEAPAGVSQCQAGSGVVGMETVVRRLEVEIATLRGGLAAVTAQLADKSLPAYTE